MGTQILLGFLLGCYGLFIDKISLKSEEDTWGGSLVSRIPKLFEPPPLTVKPKFKFRSRGPERRRLTPLLGFHEFSLITLFVVISVLVHVNFRSSLSAEFGKSLDFTGFGYR